MERLGCLTTRIFRMIVLLARSESKTGGLNHSYFTYDREPCRFRGAVEWAQGRIGVALTIHIISMIVHMGVYGRLPNHIVAQEPPKMFQETPKTLSKSTRRGSKKQSVHP